MILRNTNDCLTNKIICMKTKIYQKELIKKGYRQFPYIIIKAGYAIYMQIPIHFFCDNKINVDTHPGTHITSVSKFILTMDKKSQILNLEDRIFERFKLIIKKIEEDSSKTPKLCLVLGEDKAVYYSNGNYLRSHEIPEGGTLIDQYNNIIGINIKHFKNEK